MLTGLRSHSMSSLRKGKRHNRWIQQPRSGGPVGYADIEIDEAFMCGARVIAFHPTNSAPLAFTWPDGRMAFNARFFTPADATELIRDASRLAARSK